jgi:glycyl-tRNA synthetase beta chain
LTKKEADHELKVSLLVDETELALEKGISQRRKRFETAIADGMFGEAYQLAGELVPLIEALFQAVMIMVEDIEVKNNRLALLGECIKMLGCLGELSVLA